MVHRFFGMKRLIPFLIFALISISICNARDSNIRNFHQEGWASHTIDTEQLSAKHPSLPFGTQVRITNPQNGKAAVVTIVGRIPASRNCIIDLSMGAAASLGLSAEGGAAVILELADNHKVPLLPVLATPTPPEEENAPPYTKAVGRGSVNIYPQSGASWARWGTR
ncbi:hypothetical protein FACS1894106_4940 [Spirochaetia bacterium]|nr:hypothetical protein FACS1894106_4940 [Spirochaetia bacterium]